MTAGTRSRARAGSALALSAACLLAATAVVLAAPWRFWTVAMAFIPDPAFVWVARLRWGAVALCAVGALAVAALYRRPGAVAWGARAVAALAVLGACWATLELALPRLLHRFPLGLQPFVHGPAQRLSQSSKQGLLPRDWILVAGDSYAVGAGDWVRAASPWRNPPFQTTHVLHARLGRDVLAFGRTGSGSVRALAIGPAQDVVMLGDRFPLERPRLVPAYFYEGNDVEDNLREIQTLGVSPGELFAEAGRARLAAAVERESLASPWWRPDAHRFLAARLGLHAAGIGLQRTAAQLAGHRLVTAEIEARAVTLPRGGTGKSRLRQGNFAWIGGASVPIGTWIEGPALGLDDQTLAAATDIFAASLAILKTRFRGTPVAVVYIPAPLSLYRLDRVAHGAMGRHNIITTASHVAERTIAIRRAVAAATTAQGVPFLDAGPLLRRRAETEPIHGPVDWSHLNRAGYEALADAIVEGLRAHPGLLPPPRP